MVGVDFVHIWRNGVWNHHVDTGCVKVGSITIQFALSIPYCVSVYGKVSWDKAGKRRVSNAKRGHAVHCHSDGGNYNELHIRMSISSPQILTRNLITFRPGQNGRNFSCDIFKCINLIQRKLLCFWNAIDCQTDQLISIVSCNGLSLSVPSHCLNKWWMGPMGKDVLWLI